MPSRALGITKQSTEVIVSAIEQLEALLPVLREKEKAGLILPSVAKAESLIQFSFVP